MSGRPRGGGSKSVFSQKRRKIHPLYNSPLVSQSNIKYIHTTDPMQISHKAKFYSGGELAETIAGGGKAKAQRLENARTRAKIEKQGDTDFEAFTNFIEGKRFNNQVSGRRFQAFYDKVARQDDVVVWLCMTAMAVLNPGDLQSRLLYRHLHALTHAVASGDMEARTAFYFYENAIKSPAYRVAAQRQLLHGNGARLVGICAGAETLKNLNVCRRGMQPYYELYQRITERSEVFTPWGFPPLYQFEEKMGIFERLRPFSRVFSQQTTARRARVTNKHGFRKYYSHKIVWVAPTWRNSKNYMGNNYSYFKNIVPD